MSENGSAEFDRLLADRITRIREASGLTQTEICVEIFGDPKMQSYWSRWERGAKRPNIFSLEKIARYAGLSLEAFSTLGPGVPSELAVLEARRLLRRALELLGED